MSSAPLLVRSVGEAELVPMCCMRSSVIEPDYKHK